MCLTCFQKFCTKYSKLRTSVATSVKQLGTYLCLSLSISIRPYSQEARWNVTFKWYNIWINFFLLVAQLPKLGLGRPLLTGLEHTKTHRSLYDSSEEVISSSHRPLPTEYTTNTRDEHPCPHRLSHPQFQQKKGFRTAP